MKELTLKELRDFINDLDGYPDDSKVKVFIGATWLGVHDVSGWVGEEGHSIVFDLIEEL